MKKLIFLIFLVACLGSCRGTYDNIADFVTEENVYPGRFDTIIGKVGFERVELDLLKAGRLPASQIKLGKAKNTIVEYDGKKIEIDSVCSWVSVKNLTQPKLYRFSVYTTDENGYKSVPQEIPIKPYTSADYQLLVMAMPRVTASPWAIDLKWAQPSSVLLEYVDMNYKYKNSKNEMIEGTCKKNPIVNMVNLEPENDYSIEVKYRIVPKADGKVILDTTFLTYNYPLKTPSAEAYKKNLKSRDVVKTYYNMIKGVVISWKNVTDEYMQYSIVTYSKKGVETEVTVANEETLTFLPDYDLGTTYKVRTNYAVVGVPGAFIDSYDFVIEEPYLDLYRGTPTAAGTGDSWHCVYTSVQPATDGFSGGGDAKVGAHNAHIDSDIKSMLSLAKPGKSVNGSTNNGAVQMPMRWVIDRKDNTKFNYMRWHHRTTDTGNGLRVWALQIYGSDDYTGPKNQYTNPTAASPDEDNTTWNEVGSVITFPTPISVESANFMLPMTEYRYIRVEYKVWDTVNNSAAQLSEFYLGIKHIEK